MSADLLIFRFLSEIHQHMYTSFVILIMSNPQGSKTVFEPLPTFSFITALLSAVVDEEVVEAAPAPATPMSEPGAC